MDHYANNETEPESKPFNKSGLIQAAFSAAVLVADMGDFEIVSGSCKSSVPNSKGRYAGPVKPKSVRLGRNDQCHCGSGRKFKNCCLEQE